MTAAIQALATWSRLTGNKNDDAIDRVSHIYTVLILVIFSIVVTTGSYVGDAIRCWIPGEMDKDHYINYVLSYCWISNTYYVPMHKSVPENPADRHQNVIVYYQWVPIILLFQAFLFKLPNVLWQMLNSGNGINLDKIVALAEKTQLVSQEERMETIDYIGDYIDKWIAANKCHEFTFYERMRKKVSAAFCLSCSKRDGTYLTGIYLLTKILYATNAIGQFFLLNALLAKDYHLYGLDVIDHLSKHGEIKESVMFPRVTYCDFYIRQLSNVLPYTAQCVLPINLFNEKIYIFLWFWLLFVSMLACLNLVSWLYRVLISNSYVHYIFKYLALGAGRLTRADKHQCELFAAEYLRRDAILLLRIVGKNSTDLVVSDLLLHLWKSYKLRVQSASKETAIKAPPMHCSPV